MKTVNVTYLNHTNDKITNVADLIFNQQDNTFVIKATDNKLNVIIPRENIRYLHIKEETENGSSS